MKIILLAFIVSLGIAGSISAQASQHVTLRDGQEKNIVGSKYTVKFVSVLEDSRCPVGAACVWSGNAKIKIQLTKKGGETEDIELNTNLKPQTVEYKGYEIKIVTLSPRPGENVKAMAARHTAVLEISQAKH